MAYEQEIKQAVLDLVKFTASVGLNSIPDTAVIADVRGSDVFLTIRYDDMEHDKFTSARDSGEQLRLALTYSGYVHDAVIHRRRFTLRDSLPLVERSCKVPEITLKIPDEMDSVTKLRSIIKSAVLEHAEHSVLAPLSGLESLMRKIAHLPPQQSDQIRKELGNRVSRILGLNVGRDTGAV